jgi:hypothetical protein
MPFQYFFLPNLAFELVASAVLLIVAVTVAAARAPEDPRGHRLPATYLAVVLFVSLFVTVLSATSGFASLMSLIGDDDDSSEAIDVQPQFGPDDLLDPGFEAEEFSDEDGDEEDTEDEVSGAAVGFLTAAVAGAAFEYHRRRAGELVDSDGFREGPGRQVLTGYVYAAAFVAVPACIGGAASALYGLAKVIVPTALAIGEAGDIRETGARQAFTGGFLALVSAAVATAHLGRRDWLSTAPSHEPPEPDPVEVQ